MPYLFKKLFYLLSVTLFLTPSVLWAKHIVGGEITYRFISRNSNVNRYEFTMRIYRDCDATGTPAPAQLDSKAIIGAYAKGSGRFLESYTADLIGAPRRIGPPNLPCLIPPDVCVEEGLYIWQRDLPIIDDTYVILYARCCRNEAIDNIVRPGDVGASYSVEITNASQEAGNNSPTFQQFPPTVICAGYSLNFNHGAKDTEGDQLVYKFCEPYTGGGRFQGGGCDAVVPNPPCWPPVGNIVYRTPEYSFQNPMGGNPIVTINSATGMITGTPTEQGLFVVSVCVEEYRNGKLLSILKRDFQFDVEICNPTVLGSVKADTIINKTYIISTCGEKNVNIVNTSLDRKFINDFRFDIKMQGVTKTFRDWEPQVAFPDTGIYKGNLYLNPGTQCADTLNLQFNIFNGIFSDFNYQYDTCVAGPVAFTEKTQSLNGAIVQYKWSFGDGKDTILRNPTYLYSTPGIKNVRLSIKDIKGCAKDTTKSLTWQPVPPLLLIQPSTFSGCTPGNVVFKNLSKPIDSTYNIKWSFGDGGTSGAISPTYSYKTPGVYTVSLDVTSPIGCKTSRSFRDWIKISQGTIADFDYLPQKITTFNNTVNFTDKSSFATNWQWFFDTKGFSTKQNPTYTFKDSGLYRVKLIVANQFGCLDSLIKFLDVEPKVTYWLPNAFTPNDDSVNDLFKGVGIVAGMKNFSMKIWNRWGELILKPTILLKAGTGKNIIQVNPPPKAFIYVW